MDIMEAKNLLKKYNLYDEAQRECKRKKIDEVPYDMQGHHKIFCQYLGQKRNELQEKVNKLQNIKCVEFDNIPDNSKIVHNECFFVNANFTRNFCKTECRYYRENLAILLQKIKELREAEQVLKEVAKQDYWLR